MFSNLTIIFPLAVALYALLWCCRWASVRRRTALAPQPDEAGGTAPDRRFGRLDWYLMGGLTLVYAVVAFIGLGDTDAPQSYLHFEQGNLVFYRYVRTQVSAAVLDYDGNIRAISGGLGEKQFDLGLNRATTPHQTGSTMKPIGTYCLALENRIINYSYPVCDIPLYQASDKQVLDTEKVKQLGLSNNRFDS